MTVALVLLLSALLAIAFGFISPDSWGYILLAKSFCLGKGFTYCGEYVAVWPCGYPLAIALTAPSTDIVSLLITSKLTNFILLFTGFLLLAVEIRNILVVTFIILT